MFPILNFEEVGPCLWYCNDNINEIDDRNNHTRNENDTNDDIVYINDCDNNTRNEKDKRNISIDNASNNDHAHFLIQ